MKFTSKLLVFLSLAALTGGSIAAYTFTRKLKGAPGDVIIDSDEETYEMRNDNYTFTLTKSNLKFVITKGTQSWNSGALDPEDTETITARERLLTNPVEVYMLINNANTSETSFSIYNKNVCETSIRILNMEDYLSAHLNVVVGKRSEPDLNASFDINYYLMEDGLKISVTGVHEEKAKYTLSKLGIYPGFGMSYQNNNSKYLIPEGSGAIIDLSIPTKASSQLILPMYDRDIGVNTSARSSYTSDKLSIPMFANYSNEKTMIATVESGSEYSDLNIKVNGMVDKYNSIYYRFTYKEIMTYEIPSMNIDNPIVNKTPQSTPNDCTPTIYYHLYDEGMEYYDIATKYQEYLISRNMMGDRYSSSNMRLEFLMAENKKAFFGKETIVMTSADFIRGRVEEDLVDFGSNLSISVRGYTKGGYGNSYPYSFPIEEKTGKSSSYASLGLFLQERNIDLNFTVDVVSSYQDEKNNHNALNITQNPISSKDYINNTNMTVYRVNPSESASLVRGYESNLDAYYAAGFNFSSIGNELFSTYHRESNTRTTSMEKYVEALKSFSHIRNVRKPSYYVFPYFENYLDAPTSNGGYLVETSSIPFIQMVFSGYKSFYSSPINLNYLGDKQLVEMIDYNVYPSYLLTEADTMNLIDSPSSSYIFSSQYSNWIDNIKHTYNKVINVLKEVKGAKFIKRETLAPGVYKNTYDNGKTIIVNYTNNDYEYNSHTVASLSGEVF